MVIDNCRQFALFQELVFLHAGFFYAFSVEKGHDLFIFIFCRLFYLVLDAWAMDPYLMNVFSEIQLNRYERFSQPSVCFMKCILYVNKR